MSTHSYVGMVDEIGQNVNYIYVHFDGYPSGVGKELLDNFNSLKLAKELIDGGNCSSIRGMVDRYDDSLKYETDNIEKFTTFTCEDQNTDYTYLYTHNGWIYTNGNKNGWKLLDSKTILAD